MCENFRDETGKSETPTDPMTGDEVAGGAGQEAGDSVT